MKWLIFFVMLESDPFAIQRLQFENRNDCVDYVNEPSNASSLAIEVIAKAGFNDEIVAVVCMLENEVQEKLNSGVKT